LNKQMGKKKLVVLSGAGVSAESGIRTFRDMGGLWEEYDIYEVASPQGWNKDFEMVLRFYNERRKQLLGCVPNAAHNGLAALEEFFDVEIVTQNVDDLHERAGSSKVLHLHGELKKSRSTADPDLVYDIKSWELNPGDKCEKGSQLRPHIVWFGEAVPAIMDAVPLFRKADICVVVGTSLNVYPAAGLIEYVKGNAPVFLIDPNETNIKSHRNLVLIKEKATTGVAILSENLKKFL
jgi:NAD-dependent deacetylase